MKCKELLPPLADAAFWWAGLRKAWKNLPGPFGLVGKSFGKPAAKSCGTSEQTRWIKGLLSSTLLPSALLIAMGPSGAMAEDPEPDKIQENSIAQISSIEDLGDVKDPNHWAYGHLEELVRVYQCVAGFYEPSTEERTFRGEQDATRYEMVALLNSCLDKGRNIQNQNHTCSDSQSEPGLKDLKRVATLIIKNNDNLKSLDFLGVKTLRELVIENNDNLKSLDFSNQQSQIYKDLRTLIIKNNDKLTTLNSSGIKSRKLTSVTIDNNKKLEDLQLQNLKKSQWRAFFSWPSNYESPLTVIIKRNNCLRDLKLENLNNLRELRIEDNDNLIKIKLNNQPLSNGQPLDNGEVMPRASPPRSVNPTG